MLGARNPAFDYRLPSPVSRYAMDGTAAFMRDFETGERRYGTRADIEDAMRVFQAADMGVIAWPPVAASDRPVASRPLHEFTAMLSSCSKHGQHELHTREQAPFLGALLAAIAGGEAAVRERHEASVVYCPVAPLVHDGPMLDAYLDLGDLDVPVMVMPMPIPGTTGPGSVLGNLTLANAEALSSIVVFQLAHPGRPLIYSSAVGSMDFRSGAYLGGTPEMGIQSAALTSMGRFYGLPATAAGCTADAHEPGPEAVIEKLVTMLPPASAGADIIIGFGEIDGDQTLVLEQILVDNELARYVERLVRGRGGVRRRGAVRRRGRGGSGRQLPGDAGRATGGAERGVPTSRRSSAGCRTTRGCGLGRPSMYGRARAKVRGDPGRRRWWIRCRTRPSTELDRILAEADRALAE